MLGLGSGVRVDPKMVRSMGSPVARHFKQINRSHTHTHTHTHTPKENNTPDTDTHTHD